MGNRFEVKCKDSPKGLNLTAKCRCPLHPCCRSQAVPQQRLLCLRSHSWTATTSFAALGGGAYGEVFLAEELLPLATGPPTTQSSTTPPKSAGEERSGKGQATLHVPHQMQLCAIKRINFDLIPEDVEDVVKEVAFMSTARHPNIVSFKAAYIVSAPAFSHAASCCNSVCLVEEWVEGGSVAQLFPLKAVFDEAELSAVCASTLQALQYLHRDCLLIHRDIKCGNVLMSRHGVVKVTDFGAGGRLDGPTSTRFTVVGTPGFMAPEIMQQLRSNGDENAEFQWRAHREGTGQTFAIDIWSLGVALLEMIFHCPPEDSPAFAETIASFASATPMPAGATASAQPKASPTIRHRDAVNYSSDLTEFVALCLARDPAARPSASECLRHPFISKHMVEHAQALKGLGKLFPAEPQLQQQLSQQQQQQQRTGTSRSSARAQSKRGGISQMYEESLKRRLLGRSATDTPAYTPLHWCLKPARICCAVDGSAAMPVSNASMASGKHIDSTANRLLYHLLVGSLESLVRGAPHELLTRKSRCASQQCSFERDAAAVESLVQKLLRTHAAVPNFATSFAMHIARSQTLANAMLQQQQYEAAMQSKSFHGDRLPEEPGTLIPRMPSASSLSTLGPAVARDALPSSSGQLEDPDAAPDSAVDICAYTFNLWRDNYIVGAYSRNAA